MNYIYIIKNSKMEFKLFVRNIPYNIDEKEFKSEMQKVEGMVECNLVTKVGRPINNGYGFISVNSEEKQNELIVTNNIVIRGRILRFAKYINQQKYYKLHVMNIPLTISEQELLNFFSKFGQVDSVKRDFNVVQQQYRTTAVVVYDNYEDFKSVLELRTVKYDGQTTFDIVKRRTFKKRFNESTDSTRKIVARYRNPFYNGQHFQRNNDRKKLTIIRP